MERALTPRLKKGFQIKSQPKSSTHLSISIQIYTLHVHRLYTLYICLLLLHSRIVQIKIGLVFGVIDVLDSPMCLFVFFFFSSIWLYMSNVHSIGKQHEIWRTWIGFVSYETFEMKWNVTKRRSKEQEWMRERKKNYYQSYNFYCASHPSMALGRHLFYWPPSFKGSPRCYQYTCIHIYLDEFILV